MITLLEVPSYPLISLVLSFNVLLATIGALILWLVRKDQFWVAFFPILALSLLGFVAGTVMANSREAAVGAVLPAVLTMVGGLLVYLAGAKGLSTQSAVSIMVICFVFAFFVGTNIGSSFRVAIEHAGSDPFEQRDRELAAQDNNHAVEVRKLKQYLEFIELKRDLEKQSGVDLSRFKSVYETA
jgi:hypothetical protein